MLTRRQGYKQHQRAGNNSTLPVLHCDTIQNSICNAALFPALQHGTWRAHGGAVSLGRPFNGGGHRQEDTRTWDLSYVSSCLGCTELRCCLILLIDQLDQILCCAFPPLKVLCTKHTAIFHKKNKCTRTSDGSSALTVAIPGTLVSPRGVMLLDELWLLTFDYEPKHNWTNWL